MTSHWFLLLLSAVAYAGPPMERPRLLLCGQTLAELREKVKDPAIKPWWHHALKECDRLLTVPPNEPPVKPSTPQDRSPGELMSARRGQGAIVTLSLGYLLTGNKEYLERAWVEIDCWLNRWNNWTDPAHGDVHFFDLMVGEMGLTLGLAYDWLKDDLSPERREMLRDHLSRRIVDLYLANTEWQHPAWWFHAHHNWNAVCNGGAIVAALALGDEHPRSAELIARATANWKPYFAALGNEGGCDEGTGYWQYGIRYGVIALEALKERGHDVADIMAGRGLHETGLFPISFCPAGTVTVSWGDASSPVKDPVPYLLGRWYKNADCIRYIDRTAGHHEHAGWPVSALAAVWRPINESWLPKAGSVFDLPTARVYKEIGWSVFTDSWTDPTFIAGFKCGDLGANHTHLDNNTFVLWSCGEWLALDLGAGVYNADYFSEKRWKMYVVELAGHNGLLIGGRGQLHGAKGALTVDRLDQDLAVVSGDATANYGPGVRRAIRHFAVVRRSYAVVVDDVETDAPEKLEWRLHTSSPATILGSRATVKGEKASLNVIFPENAVTHSIAEDSRELPPGRHDHLLSAAIAQSVTSILLPAVLSPASQEPPKVSFIITGEGVEITVGADRLVWKRPSSAWTISR